MDKTAQPARLIYSGKKKYVKPLELVAFMYKLALKYGLIFI